jgi:hypothetical protein
MRLGLSVYDRVEEDKYIGRPVGCQLLVDGTEGKNCFRRRPVEVGEKWGLYPCDNLEQSDP